MARFPAPPSLDADRKRHWHVNPEAGLGAGNAVATDRVNASLALLFWLEGLAATTRDGARPATADNAWETYPPETAADA